MNIKYKNKVRLAKYIAEHNGIDVDPRSIFDVQVKRLHEYKRQLLNILHIMYLYNQLKANPDMEFHKRSFIFGAKAAAGYVNAKLTIKLINSVADVINNDESINDKIKVVFIEDYRVSNNEIIIAASSAFPPMKSSTMRRTAAMIPCRSSMRIQRSARFWYSLSMAPIPTAIPSCSVPCTTLCFTGTEWIPLTATSS